MKLSEQLRAHLEHIHGRTIPEDVAYVIQCVELAEESPDAFAYLDRTGPQLTIVDDGHGHSPDDCPDRGMYG